MRTLIVGCGYVGIELGRRLSTQGHEVWGIRQSPSGAAELTRAGIHPLVLDITAPGAFDAVDPGFDWIVNAVSSKGGGEEGYRRVYLEGTQRILDWLRPAPPRRYVHISSTSVYGQADGSWVTELSPAEPANATSKVLVETEALILKARQNSGLDATVLRSAGIYGPDRGHLFLQYLKGEALLTGDGMRWLNMIHRDDLASCIVAALHAPDVPPLINVGDDLPVTERDFFEWLSQTLGRPMPASRPPEEKSRKRGATDKRVSNALLRQSLGITLTYPTFREGYGAELARQGHHDSH